MKLKEKLASEYAIKKGKAYRLHRDTDNFLDIEDGFIAGFKKAREMALNELKNALSISGATYFIESMGEEEVD